MRAEQTHVTPMAAARSAPAARARSFDVVTAVWGAEHRQLFLDVCVPNQLTRSNLEALPAGSRYRVFTSAEDADIVRRSPALRQVGELMTVDVVVMPQLSASARSRFTRMTACHRRALTDARDAGSAVIFLCADNILSAGTCAAVVRRHAAGTRAVMCTGVWVDRDAFLAALEARGGIREVPPRDMVAAAIEHLHPSSRLLMAGGRRTARRPQYVFWDVPGEGIVARCFHLHPLMVDPVRRDVLPDETIDGHFVRHACPARTDVHVVADSDEFVMFEMSRADEVKVDTVPGGVSLWTASRMVAHCDSHQESYWMQPIRLHARDFGGAWTVADRHSRRFAGAARAIGVARRLLSVRHLKRLARLEGVRRDLKRAKKRARRSMNILLHSAARRVQKRAQ